MRRGPVLNQRKRWIPKRWDVHHEQMVLLSCAGVSNIAIAERFGYTPQAISMILNTPQAKTIKELVKVQSRKQLMETFTDRMEVLQERALSNIEKVINDDELLEKSPFSVVDRSMQLLKGVGKLIGEGATINNNSQTVNVIGEAAVNRLAEAIEKSNQVQRLHNIEITPAKSA